MGKANRNRAARAELGDAGILYRNNRNRRGINSQEAKTTEFFKYQEIAGKSLTLFSQKTALGYQLCLKIEEAAAAIKILTIAEKINPALAYKPNFFLSKDQEDQTQRIIISHYEGGSVIASSYNLKGDLPPKTLISFAESDQVKTIKTSETQFSIITKKTGQNAVIKQYSIAKGELREGPSLALTKKPPASLASVAMSTELSSVETVVLYKGYYLPATLEERFYFSKIIGTTEEAPKVISFFNITPEDISGVSLIKNPDPKATAKYLAIFKGADTLYVATFKKDRNLLSESQLVKLSPSQATATLEIESFSYQYSSTVKKFRLFVTAKSSNNPSITANNAEDNFVQEVTFKMNRLGNAVDLSSVTNERYKVLAPEVLTTTSRFPTSELETTFVSLSPSTSALGSESTSATSLLTSLASLTSTFLFSSTILTTETTHAPSTSITTASSTTLVSSALPTSTSQLGSTTTISFLTSLASWTSTVLFSPTMLTIPTTSSTHFATNITSTFTSETTNLPTVPNMPAAQTQNDNTLLIAGGVVTCGLGLISAACTFFCWWCCGKRKTAKVAGYYSPTAISSTSSITEVSENLPLGTLDNPFVSQVPDYASIADSSTIV